MAPGYDTWKVSLLDQYKVEATQCSGKSCGNVIKGKWSPIYAQAMVVELDNGLRFVANFRYNIKEEICEDPINKFTNKLALIDTSHEEAFHSVCNQTMVGIVQDSNSNDGMKNFKATCFIGSQISKIDIETTTEETRGEGKSMIKQAKIIQKGKRTNLHMEHVPNDTTDLLINTVNSGNFGWKADECKLQKKPAHCNEKEIVMLAQVEDGEFGNKNNKEF